MQLDSYVISFLTILMIFLKEIYLFCKMSKTVLSKLAFWYDLLGKKPKISSKRLFLILPRFDSSTWYSPKLESILKNTTIDLLKRFI